jgi:Phasin protein
MARSSQAKGSRAARAMTPKAPVNRPPVRRNAGGSEPTPATGPVALAEPEAKPEAFVSADSQAPAEPAPAADGLGAADREVDAPAGAEAAGGAPPELGPAAAPETAPEATPEATKAAAPAPAAPAAPAPAAPAPAEPASASAGTSPTRAPWAAGPGPDLTAMFEASRALVEGSIRVRSQMIGFGCRQAEHGLAVGRAMLAGGSLPEVLTLQAEYFQGAVGDALAQALEVGRLSADALRTGLESLRPR